MRLMPSAYHVTQTDVIIFSVIKVLLMSLEEEREIMNDKETSCMYHRQLGYFSPLDISFQKQTIDRP